MPIATWTPDLSTGVSSLDDDHKQLIDTLNEVFDALLLGRSSMILRTALSTLNDYVVEHFAREEEWMCEIDDPGLPDHRREHQALRDHIESIISLQDMSDDERSIELLVVLGDWLLGHIANSDIQTARPNE
jgi:hemerythrin-like metal-binding protein